MGVLNDTGAAPLNVLEDDEMSDEEEEDMEDDALGESVVTVLSQR